MFMILSILVLIAAMNIVSGLIMLVKNKSRDIGILRTMGLTEGSILRIFFICGASIGVMRGTLAGVAWAVLSRSIIDPIFAFVNWVAGGGVWDPSVRGSVAFAGAAGAGRRLVGGVAGAGAVLRRSRSSRRGGRRE